MHSENRYEISFMVGGDLSELLVISRSGEPLENIPFFSLELQTNYFNMQSSDKYCIFFLKK